MFMMSWLTLADIKGGAGTPRPPHESKFFQFHADFRKCWQNRVLPTGELAPLNPPLVGVDIFNYTAVMMYVCCKTGGGCVMTSLASLDVKEV